MLDPRTRLILAVYGAVWVVATARIYWLLAGWGLLLALVIGIGRFSAYARWLRMVVPMAFFFGAMTGWSAGCQAGMRAALTLLVLVSIFFVFFSVTAPEDLGNAMVKMGLPHTAAFVFSTALQFVPVIGRKARCVIDAQRSRGIPLEPGWKALRYYPAFLGPLLIQAFRMAEELAEAMEARGFGLAGRTYLRDYRLQRRDWLVLAAGLVFLAGWIWRQSN